MKAWLNLRYTLTERVATFRSGLERLGYTVMQGATTEPKEGDLLCTWNRIGHADRAACQFEWEGLPVVVVENALWGNHFAGQHWYSMALSYHNTAGNFPVGGPERWDDLGVELDPWRTEGKTLILPQRGIGPKSVAMPSGWADSAFRRFGGRVRHHPGQRDCRPLEDDLEGIGKVVTWGSGAALKALMWGVPVISEMPNWIAEQDNTDAGRLAMCQRLAWAQVRLTEIADGSALARLLGH